MGHQVTEYSNLVDFTWATDPEKIRLATGQRINVKRGDILIGEYVDNGDEEFVKYHFMLPEKDKEVMH